MVNSLMLNVIVLLLLKKETLIHIITSNEAQLSTAKDFTAKIEENIWDKCPGKRGGGWVGICASLELTEPS